MEESAMMQMKFFFLLLWLYIWNCIKLIPQMQDINDFKYQHSLLAHTMTTIFYEKYSILKKIITHESILVFGLKIML